MCVCVCVLGWGRGGGEAGVRCFCVGTCEVGGP